MKTRCRWSKWVWAVQEVCWTTCTTVTKTHNNRHQSDASRSKYECDEYEDSGDDYNDNNDNQIHYDYMPYMWSSLRPGSVLQKSVSSLGVSLEVPFSSWQAITSKQSNFEHFLHFLQTNYNLPFFINPWKILKHAFLTKDFLLSFCKCKVYLGNYASSMRLQFAGLYLWYVPIVAPASPTYG